jgi:hypothetical protein
MAITVPKPKKPANPDEFIGAAPDAAPSTAESIQPKRLKARRGPSRSQVSVVLADDLVARIDERAAKRYMSRSAFITMALSELLERGEA